MILRLELRLRYARVYELEARDLSPFPALYLTCCRLILASPIFHRTPLTYTMSGPHGDSKLRKAPSSIETPLLEPDARIRVIEGEFAEEPADIEVQDSVERAAIYDRFSDQLIERLRAQHVDSYLAMEKGPASLRESSWRTLELLVVQGINRETADQKMTSTCDGLVRSGLIYFLTEVAAHPQTWIFTRADNTCLYNGLCRSLVCVHCVHISISCD